ncbi:MAG: hypothetical protein ACUZ8H_04190 [Candidatus Anammoxibacter sp.]
MVKNSDNLNRRFISSIIDDAPAGKSFSPHIELVESIINGVKQAGVKEENCGLVLLQTERI